MSGTKQLATLCGEFYVFPHFMSEDLVLWREGNFPAGYSNILEQLCRTDIRQSFFVCV